MLANFGLVWDGNDYLGQVMQDGEGANDFANRVRTVDSVMFGKAQDFMVDYFGKSRFLPPSGRHSDLSLFRQAKMR